MIPQITLSGTPYEMGLAFGEAFRNKIHEFALTRVARLKQYIKDYCQVSISDEELLSRVKALIPYHQRYDAALWAEFEGIAKGANISFELLTIVMGYTDLRDYFTQRIEKEIADVGGCSAFIVPDGSSKQGVICGQTWDMTVEALDYLVIVHRKPKTGIETVYLTTMGCLGLIGLNSNGVAIGNTNLMSIDNQPGVHYLFTISKALSMESLDAAVGAVVNTPRLAGHNFFLANATKGVNIEATAQFAFCSLISEVPHVQTNHYLNDSLRSLQRDLPKNIIINTDYRIDRMTNHFAKDKTWDLESCWNVLADDTRHELGAAICNEDYNGKFGDFATVATVVLVPKERMMRICAKGAKNGTVQEVQI